MKITIFILLSLILFSCSTPTVENSVSDMSVEKYREITSLPKDTVIIANQDNSYYHFEDGELQIRSKLNDNNSRTFSVGELLFIIITSLIIGIFLGMGIAFEISDRR